MANVQQALNSLQREVLEALVVRIAKEEHVDPLLLRAICTVETDWVPERVKYEPHFNHLWFPREVASRLGITEVTETELQRFSYGLPQVMGALCRELGFTGHMGELHRNRELPIRYACRKIKRDMVRYGDDPPALMAAYNGGSALKTQGGFWYNQKYVDHCSQVYRALVEGQNPVAPSGSSL